MRFASLGSGSKGNALVVEAGDTRVMLDCGFSVAETERRLARRGLVLDDIDAILVTHEHDDHIGGVARLAARARIPVHLTSGTLAAAERRLQAVQCICFDPHEVFVLGDLEIHPYPVPHDAREPAQYVFSDGEHSLGVLTDVGIITPHIRRMLSGCSALVLECNHDSGLLRDGPYPGALKKRIASRLGHLPNDDAAELLASLDNARLRHLVAAHLSDTNNTPELAKAALAGAIGANPEEVCVATQEEGCSWMTID